MNTACRDAVRFQSVGEHQRETMLMHFAEPLQFIHNLDIAHVFEHYYRYMYMYMCRRGTCMFMYIVLLCIPSIY